MVGAASLTHPTKTGAVGCGGGGYAYPPYEEWGGGLWWVRLRLLTLRRLERWVVAGAATLTHPTKNGAVGYGGCGFAYPPYKDYKTLRLMVGRVSAAHPRG